MVRKVFKTILKSLGGLLLLSIAFVLVAAVLATLIDYSPPEMEILNPQGKADKKQISKDQVSLMSWNIGYGGLGSKMDFFYDGGNKVRPTRKYYNEYFVGIESFLQENDSIDFLLLQEVDQKSHRSYRDNQEERIKQLFPGHQSVFAKNYNVPFVPVPVNNPMGKVVSGLMNLSKYEAMTSERISFPGNYAWPKSIFMLDRCFIIQRFVVKGEKVLTMINTHNSAFDDGGLRKEQFKMLREIAKAEYAKGHYVIIGGDWNQNPPGFYPGKINNGDTASKNDLPNVADNFMPSSWIWYYDPAVPTNRDVSQPYQKGQTSTTILDYFLLSPNLNPKRIKTIDLGFEFSDHNPVVMEVEFGDYSNLIMQNDGSYD
jgi:endonuclease/exonuclease/phosphatase family metal-dependent hydrolase